MSATHVSIQKLAIDYQELVADINLDQFEVPLNLAEASVQVQEAYEDGTSFDPIFEFRQLAGNELARVSALLQRAESIESEWVDPLVSTLKYMVATIKDSENRTALSATARTASMYGAIDPLILVKATSELRAGVVPIQEQANIEAEQAKKIVQQALNAADLGDWRVDVQFPMNAMMDVSSERREIRIRRGAKFSRTAIARLLVHEVGCHVFRSASGAAQPISLLAFGLGDYLRTEEGLACYQESRSGLSDPVDSRRLPLRYLAAALSLCGGLSSVYAALRQFSDHEQSFETAARAKRGITVTSEAGAHLKDKVYFEGMEMVDRYVREGGELSLLYVGKVSLSTVPAIRTALQRGELITPAFGPDRVADLIAVLD